MAAAFAVASLKSCEQSASSFLFMTTPLPFNSTSSPLPVGFSRHLSPLQFDTRLTTVASWPLKQIIDNKKTSKSRAKTPAPKTDKPKPDPKPKLETSKLLDRGCNGFTDSCKLLISSRTVEALHSNSQMWLPPAPQVSRPRSIYNAASLAYLGDCVYELYVRRHFFFPPLNINEYNSRVMALVCCEAQNALLRELLKDNFLSEEERDVIRWGRNIESGKTRTVRRAGVAVYSSASSLETLVGYLYLTNANRLDKVMEKLGFCTGFAAQSTIKGMN